MKNILYAAAECGPFIKTGGLGSVLASLPRELDKEEYDVRVVIPDYACIPDEYRSQMKTVLTFPVQLNWRNTYATVRELKADGETFYFLGHSDYFEGEEPYGEIWADVEKYTFFCKAVLDMLSWLEYQPDIIHCHDWQTALIPVYLKSSVYAFDPFYKRVGTVLTVHNLRYQGICDINFLKDLSGLPDEMFSFDILEYYGSGNLLKGGIACADRLTTVSKTYADEICTPEYGEGLDGILNYRHKDLTGIVNGLDYTFYNPAKDPFIHKCYGPKTRDKAHGENKKDLQEKTGMPVLDDTIALGYVGRLTEQKGMDLLEPIMDDLVKLPIQLYVLGGGQPEHVKVLEDASEAYPDKVYLNVNYTDELAKKFYAGCDAILMPSRFEPCGLSQMMALRYGSLPLIRETGGLKDTVAVYGKNDKPTGFGFESSNPEELLDCLKTLCTIYTAEPDLWKEMALRGMRKNYSWKSSCRKYEKLYRKML